MDYLMPVMNGFDAVKGMRQARFPYLIAGVTGQVMEDDITEFLDAGWCGLHVSPSLPFHLFSFTPHLTSTYLLHSPSPTWQALTSSSRSLSE
jgi:CheY-like chemotaxis protein